MSPERGIEGASAAEGAKEHERQKPAADLVQEEREEGQHFAGGDVWTSEDAHVAREAPGLRAGALSQAGGGSLSLREEVLCTDGTGLDMDCAQEGQGGPYGESVTVPPCRCWKWQPGSAFTMGLLLGPDCSGHEAWEAAAVSV